MRHDGFVIAVRLAGVDGARLRTVPGIVKEDDIAFPGLAQMVAPPGNEVGARRQVRDILVAAHARGQPPQLLRRHMKTVGQQRIGSVYVGDTPAQVGGLMGIGVAVDAHQ